ncbi:MAG: multiheme c-type cytochrome [Planctomycetaceae bacterium]
MGARFLLPAALVAAAAMLAGRPGVAEPAEEGEGIHLGAGSCAAAACHGGTEPLRNEHTHWRQKDQHAQAYLHLLGETAQRIARRLRLPRPAHEEPSCLACHGTDPARQRVGDRFDARDGVSCELCHGGSSAWLGPHASPGWKTRAAAEKERLGMRTLSTPRSRAELCAGCHVGGPGRVVDHDLLAAGHPPLLFDAAAFTDSMPPHWTDERDATRETWFVGQTLGAAAHLETAARAAREPQRPWPEYALMECGSCHHELDAEGPYALREPPGPAGRPRLERSSLDLLALFLPAAEAVALPEPSDREAFARAAEEAAVRLRSLAAPMPPEGGGGLAALEAWLADRPHLPRTTARQAAFAIRALARDRASEPFRAAWSALEETLHEGEPFRPEAYLERARTLIAAGR